MKLPLIIDREREILQSYMRKIQQQQIIIIGLSLIVIGAYYVLGVLVMYDVIELSPDFLDILKSIQVAAAVFILATLFLGISTPILDGFFFFLERDSRSHLLTVWNYGVWVVTFVIVLAQFTGSLESLGISIGVFSAGLAIAMQQPLTSLVGWVIILSKRVYKVGDRILIKDIKGDVDQITPFNTVLREVGGDMKGFEPTGVKITFPNNIVLTEAIHNYSSDFPYVWEYIPVSVTYESDLALAKDLIKAATMDALGNSMEKASEKMRPYLYGTPQEQELSDEPTVLVSMDQSCVVVKVKFICRQNKRHKIKSDITDKILDAFNKPENKNRVAIAYPHMQLVFHEDSVDGVFKKKLHGN
ncbi:MAG: mechanosensitive ion channel family protein [Candidatus Altiarchaeota archaeon]|nr:mechanosensitive ion channel family protein [Candidatus Altiarchaeota archaeon]